MDGLFGVGPLELIIVIALALVVLGPERLPDTIRQVVRFIKQTRAIGTELTKQFSDELNLLDDFNPKKILQDVVDLDEEFDGKELLGIDKKDLQIDDVDLGNKASKSSKTNKSSKTKKSTSTENPLSPPKGPKTPPLQSLKKTKPTRPALGETDPEDTTTSAAVVAKQSETETAQESRSSDTQVDDSQTDTGHGNGLPSENLEAETATSSTESEEHPSKISDELRSEPVTENRIAPPSMSTAQSLVAGKPALVTTKSSANEEHKAVDSSNGAKKATAKSNTADVTSGDAESVPTVDSTTDTSNTVEAEDVEDIEDA